MSTPKTQIDLGSRPLYVGTAIVLVVLLGLTIWGFVGATSRAEASIQAGDIKISRTEVLADGVDASEVVVTITQKEDNAPIPEVWVGLNIADEQLVTADLSNFGWYSPEPGRSFYQTDAQGQARFSVKSKVAGAITYSVYAADPDQKNSGKYISLDREFTINFK